MAKKEVNKTNQKDKKDKNKKTFFKSFKTELKKVVWPTPKQLLNNTVTVITIVLICAVIVFVLDMIFETINKQGIERIRDAVVGTENVVEQNATTDTNTTDTNTTATNSTTVQVNEDGSTEVVDGNESSETTTEGETNSEDAQATPAE